MLNIAVFASGRGSNFEALQRTISEKNIPAVIVAVISNNSASGVLALARSFNIPAFHISQRQFSDEGSYRKKILETLSTFGVNFIVLAGYMKKLDAEIIRAYPQRIINIHPALLPKFGGAGMYGMNVHAAVIAAGEKESGATVHYVNEQYDDGGIIAQDRVTIVSTDTAESLASKVLTIEHRLLPEVVRQFSATIKD